MPVGHPRAALADAALVAVLGVALMGPCTVAATGSQRAGAQINSFAAAPPERLVAVLVEKQ